MPRTNPLSEREKEICLRLLEFRKSLRLTRIAFASETGLDSTLLMRLEHCRVPLRYTHFFQLVLTTSLNPAWLATGVGKMIDPLAPLERGINERALFSTVWRERLCALTAEQAKRAEPLPAVQFEITPDAAGRLHAETSLKGIVGEWCLFVPDEKFSDFWESIVRCGSKFLSGSGQTPVGIIELRKFEMDKLRSVLLTRIAKEAKTAEALPESKFNIDKKPGEVHQLNMSPKADLVKSLMDRLKKATQSRGQKSDLARALGVSRQSMHNWLQGASAPSAEITLRLLQWVEASEGIQKKSPGRVDARPEQKTRSSNPSYEKQKSGPPKG